MLAQEVKKETFLVKCFFYYENHTIPKSLQGGSSGMKNAYSYMKTSKNQKIYHLVTKKFFEQSQTVPKKPKGTFASMSHS